MLPRFVMVGFCIAIATVVAMALSAISFYAYWPPRWHLDDHSLASATAVMGALYLGAVPLLVLGLIGLRRIPNAVLSCAVSCGWLLLAFLVRVRHPWAYFGEFPGWMFMRDVVQPLPTSLGVGLAFAVSARKLLEPRQFVDTQASSSAASAN